MDAQFPVTLMEKIVEKLQAEQVSGGLLEDIKLIDWGGAPPAQMSHNLPAIFVTVTGSLHPEYAAARGAEESYMHEYTFAIAVYTYVLDEGYQDAMRDGLNFIATILRICHVNKEWDQLCDTSEAGEEDEVEYGIAEFGDQAIAYGIRIPLHCVAKAQTVS